MNAGLGKGEVEGAVAMNGANVQSYGPVPKISQAGILPPPPHSNA